MSNTIEGKTVIIAAGAKNLGGLIARDLAGRGAKSIVIHYNSDATRKAAEETAGAGALLAQGDLTKPGEVRKLFDEARRAFGAPDIAINTVGMVLKKPIVETSEQEFDAMIDVNAKSAFFFVKEPGAALNDGGKICTIVTSLLAAFTGRYGIYAGGKAPVEHFTRAAAKELGPRGISVSAAALGPMDTPFF